MNPAWWFLLGPLCWLAVGIPVGVVATRLCWKNSDYPDDYRSEMPADRAGFTLLWPIGVGYIIYALSSKMGVIPILDALYTPASIKKERKNDS